MELRNLLMEAREKEARKDEAAMDLKCPGKLNLNLPLLSTRRLGSSACEASSCTSKSQDMASEVPFSWEQAPGKPKDHIRRSDAMDSPPPRPKPPPCRWQPKKQEEIPTNVDNIGGCDADADDGGTHRNKVDMFFSDALSLTEAIDIAQKAEKDRRLDKLVNLESSMDSNTDDNKSYQSSNFMMERFLPDATAIAASAIAASSILYLTKDLSKKLPFSSNEDHRDRCELKKPAEGRLTCSNSESHWKACGLEIFNPGRMKHNLCGVKSPAEEVSPANMQSWKKAKETLSTSLRL